MLTLGTLFGIVGTPVSTVLSAASVGASGLASAGGAASATPFSIPLGSSLNLGFNDLAFPWVQAVLPLLAPGDNAIFAATITQFVAVLMTTINNLLAG